MNKMSRGLIAAVLFGMAYFTCGTAPVRAQDPYWNNHWRWYDNTYRPYYHRYYAPNYNSYYTQPYYGGAYYGPTYQNPYYGPYYGGGVQVGPMRLGWW
jgi:hypothetical protein